MRVVYSYGPLGAGLTPSGLISIGSGLFSNPAAIRDLPGVVIRSLPCRSTMYPSSINRARCWAGMTAGGSRTAHVLPTVRREANSSGVRGSDSRAIIRLCPLTCIGTWSNLLKSANIASERSGGPARDEGHSRQRPPKRGAPFLVWSRCSFLTTGDSARCHKVPREGLVNDRSMGRTSTLPAMPQRWYGQLVSVQT
jgi:hypothetical protein